MMRSPPPPASQNPSQPPLNNYGNPYQAPPAAGAGSGGGFGPGFNFMNDPTAQMSLQVGQHAMKAGQDYVEQNVCDELAHRRMISQRDATCGNTD